MDRAKQLDLHRTVCMSRLESGVLHPRVEAITLCAGYSIMLHVWLSDLLKGEGDVPSDIPYDGMQSEPETANLSLVI